MRNKHNKKRNTLFLYESLIQELTKSIIKKDNNKKKKVLLILREFFSGKSVLRTEIGLYNSLIETKGVDAYTAERILYEVYRIYSTLDKDTIFTTQSKLIKKINKDLDKKFYNNFIPNYKTMASIGQLFQKSINVKTRILMENKLIHQMVDKKERERESKEHIDNIVYKEFVKSFNNSYKDNLIKEQKILLQKYILSQEDDMIEFKMFLNEEINRLECCIKKSSLDKKDELLSFISSLNNKEINEDNIKKILKLQSLVKEMQI